MVWELWLPTRCWEVSEESKSYTMNCGESIDLLIRSTRAVLIRFTIRLLEQKLGGTGFDCVPFKVMRAKKVNLHIKPTLKLQLARIRFLMCRTLCIKQKNALDGGS